MDGTYTHTHTHTHTHKHTQTHTHTHTHTYTHSAQNPAHLGGSGGCECGEDGGEDAFVRQTG